MKGVKTSNSKSGKDPIGHSMQRDCGLSQKPKINGQQLLAHRTTVVFIVKCARKIYLGYRSAHRDLEAQILLVTENEALKRKIIEVSFS